MNVLSCTTTSGETVCDCGRYTRAWEMGTGLRVALPPGRYHVTGEEWFEGYHFLRLDETYRVDVREVLN